MDMATRVPGQDGELLWGEIERRALKITAIIEAKRGPYMAELVPECSARWHVITTAPMSETTAAKHLVDRGFGVYIPTFNRTRMVRGQLRDLNISLFPGHIFLFVWDILRHWRRIRACPGVVSIMTTDERPVVVDDVIIDQMQAIEFNNIVLLPAKAKRRRRRREEGPAPDDMPDNKFVSITTKSYWTGIEKLDNNGRNSVLYKALGLTS